MNFAENEIRDYVLSKMRELNIFPETARDQNLILDGEIHRYRIQGDKRGSKNGAYCIHTDGIPAGFLQDWKDPNAKYNWSLSQSLDNTVVSKTDFDFETWKQQREAREAEQREIQARASDEAYEFFEQAEKAVWHHYLEAKKVNPYGIKIDNPTGNLIIPLRDINGRLQSVQTISRDGTKRFFKDAPTAGNFFSIGISTISEENETPILIGEGYATMAKIFQLTGLPVVAAMNCYNLEPVAKAIRAKYQRNPVIIMADNDIATQKKSGHNPGIEAAQKLVNDKIAFGVVAPKFNFEKPEGSDWDDFALVFGDKAAQNAMLKDEGGINWLFMSDEDKRRLKTEKILLKNIGVLDPSINLPPLEFIGGIFPRGYISSIVAPSGTGKTIFMQKFVSDLSIGGTIFEGIAENEPPRKCLIFAAEAGYELLLRRSASFKWSVNPKNALVANQYTYECLDCPLMLDDEQGLYNIKFLINSQKPDIVFFDTFASFHEKDENKGMDIKPIMMELTTIARTNNIAIVLNHHSRKRTSKERAMALNQDDVIGTSIFNRMVGIILGIEPRSDDEKTLRVKSLKTWFKVIEPFDFSIKESTNGGSVIETNLTPETNSQNARAAVWNYLRSNFKASAPGQEPEWFGLNQIVLSEIDENISLRLLRKILSELLQNGKIKKRGTTKNVEYAIIGFYG